MPLFFVFEPANDVSLLKKIEKFSKHCRNLCFFAYFNGGDSKKQNQEKKGKIMNTENVITKEIETKYKDKLFRIIFGKDDEKSKQWRLELYNALSGKKHTNPDDIELTTIENVLYITMKNDLSFLVDSQMSLWTIVKNKVTRSRNLYQSSAI